MRSLIFTWWRNMRCYIADFGLQTYVKDVKLMWNNNYNEWQSDAHLTEALAVSGSKHVKKKEEVEVVDHQLHYGALMCTLWLYIFMRNVSFSGGPENLMKHFRFLVLRFLLLTNSRRVIRDSAVGSSWSHHYTHTHTVCTDSQRWCPEIYFIKC